jgi:hypothetical protein
MKYIVFVLLTMQSACAQQQDLNSEALYFPENIQKPLAGECLPNSEALTKKVTHYYVPLLEKYDHFTCNRMEGTCIYKKKKVQWLHNYGYEDQKLSEARCKNGYGNNQNCLNPCRTIAASMIHHRYGQVYFIKELVGKRCGNLKRDGFEMIHDGLVYVGDTGSPRHFNDTGRFDFFWGRCKNKSNGVCREGALDISMAITNSPYCMVWSPDDPSANVALKEEFARRVVNEAIQRKDRGAAADFNLDKGQPPARSAEGFEHTP